jgi:hypothetical protein
MRPPADTTPEAWKVFLDIQRRMTPSEKMQRALEWSEMVRRFAEADLRRRHPAADDHEILLRYAHRTLGRELFRQAYGNALPDDKPPSRHD